MSTGANAPKASQLHALLVAPLGPVRDLAKSTLVALHFELGVASDVRRVVDHLRHQPCEVLFVEPSCLGPAPLEVLAQIKALPSPPFILALVDRFSPRGLLGLMRGGVDDFVRLPLSADEVAVRVHRAITRPSSESSGARRVAPRLAGWPSLDHYPAALVEDLGAFSGLPLKSTACGAALTDVVGASITLTQPDGQSELTVMVEMGRTTAGAILNSVLGIAPDTTVDTASIDEMLREFANLSGGALKRCILNDGVSFTIGIPKFFAGEPQEARGIPDLAFDLNSAHGPVRCLVSSRRTTMLALPLHALREGLVLARDVRNASGMLLLMAGLRLTSATIEGLQKTLDRTVQVEVIHVH